MNIETEQLESIVKRYVLDQLDDQEAEEFEAYFLSRPDVADMIDSVQNLRIGLMNDPHSESVENADVDTGIQKEPLIAKISRLIVGPVPSFAMLALLIVSTPLAIKGLSGDDQESGATLVRLGSTTVRSAGDTAGVDLSVGGGRAAFIVRVKGVEFPHYQLRVHSLDSQSEIWRSDKFAFASGSRDFLVMVPPNAARENVELKLIGVGEGGNEVSVEFCDYTEACF